MAISKDRIILLSIVTLYAVVLSTTLFHMNDTKIPESGPLRTGYRKKISSKIHTIYRKFLSLFGKKPETPAEDSYRLD